MFTEPEWAWNLDGKEGRVGWAWTSTGSQTQREGWPEQSLSPLPFAQLSLNRGSILLLGSLQDTAPKVPHPPMSWNKGQTPSRAHIVSHGTVEGGREEKEEGRKGEEAWPVLKKGDLPPEFSPRALGR